MQGKISKRTVDALQAGKILYDTEIKGFVARCLDSGTVSFGYRYRNEKGQSRWDALGVYGSITPDEARGLAKKRAGVVADGRDPVAEKEETRTEAKRAKVADTNTVDAILDRFEARYSSKLRSGDQIKRAFKVYVRPRIGEKSVYDLKRRDIVDMLDGIEDDNGPVMADRVLAHVRKAFNWWMVQDEDFKSPIVRGMARTKPGERSRDRILADDEIRDVWAALELVDAPECYPAYVRNLLLTATRRNESSELHTSELDGDVWIIPADRYKNKKDHVIPLSAMALENIRSAPTPKGKGENSRFLFSTTTANRPMGKTAFSGFSKAKAALDREIAKQRKAAGRPKMPRWTLHDLRRTARTLMSRAGVPEDYGERALGHLIGGVRGTYDRYEYLDEKRKAFEALAGLVALILNPPSGNVVQIARGSK